MARMSKRFQQARESIDKDKKYTLEESCELVKELATAGFDETVIVVQTSEAASIVQGSNANCIVLNVGECENLATIERFILGVIAQLNGVEI